MATGISINVPGSVAASAATGSGSGELNYITNPSAETDLTDWTTAGAALTLARSESASDLPREQLTGTGLKLTADASETQSTSDYIYFDFTLDDVDQNRLLKIEWSQLQQSGYVDGDFEVFIAAQSDRTTALHTPVNTSIPAQDGIFNTSFLSATTLTLSLVIRATTDMADGAGMTFSDIIVGPGKTATGAAVGSWTEFTPTVQASGSTVNLGSGSFQYGRWRRVGDSMEVYARIRFGTSGIDNGTSGTYYFTLPESLTVDADNNNEPLGFGRIADDSAPARHSVIMSPLTGTPGTIYMALSDSSVSGTSVTPTSPFTFSTQDVFEYHAMVPIAEWAGSGTMNVLQEDNLSGWTSYTGRLKGTSSDPSHGSGTVNSDRAYWRRVGENMEIKIAYEESSASPTAGSGVYYFPLPDGYTLDETVLFKDASPGSIVGSCWYYSNAASANLYGNVHVYDSGGTAYLCLLVGDASTTAVIPTGSSNPLAGTTVRYGADISVPIAEWANVNQNSLVGFSEGTSSNVGLVKKNKWQEKQLSADVNSDGAISDLTFSNLTIGKTYRAYIQCLLDTNATDAFVQLNIQHNSATIANVRINVNAEVTCSAGVVFVAAASTVTFNTNSASANAIVRGNGFNSETYARIEELNNYETETADW